MIKLLKQLLTRLLEALGGAVIEPTPTPARKEKAPPAPPEPAAEPTPTGYQGFTPPTKRENGYPQRHLPDVKMSEHFTRDEFTCHCGCGFNDVDETLVTRLEMLRHALGDVPIVIWSGCRCHKHNAAVGGATHSQHLLGTAADIKVKGVSPSVVADAIDELLPNGGGLGRYKTFTHIDSRRGKARWHG